MKAIILAAGYGNRMRPLTDNQLKTLLKINGITIIDNIIDSLISNSVYDIVIVTGYREKELKDYLIENYATVKFQFVNNPDYRTTNNIYSLALTFENIMIDDDIILIESDLIYNHNIIADLLSNVNQNLALVDRYRSGMDGTVVKLSDSNQIVEVIPPHLQDSDFTFSNKYKTLNIYKFSESFCNNIFSKLLTYYAKVINDNCYYELVLGMLIYMQQEKIYAFVVDNKDWFEVDDTNDIRLAEYKFGKTKKKDILAKSWGGYWNYDITDFCFIRNMYFPTPSMIAEVKNNFEELLWNYGSSNAIVNKKMSYFLLEDEENIVALNGAAQIFPFLKQKFGQSKVLMPSPTFGEYERIFSIKSYYSDHIGISFEDVETKVENNDVIIFVNPNNPTGSFVDSKSIVELANLYKDKFFIVDESFIDFSESQSVMELLKGKHIDNVLVVKSMSKSHGFPGVRLGYAFSTNRVLLSEIKDYLPVWNFNSFAEYFLEIMLKYRKQFNDSIKHTIIDRNKFLQCLSEALWVNSVFESYADFILIETDPIILEFVDDLLENSNIYIRDISSKFQDGKTYFRFAVRTETENIEVIKEISHLFDNKVSENKNLINNKIDV